MEFGYQWTIFADSCWLQVKDQKKKKMHLNSFTFSLCDESPATTLIETKVFNSLSKMI